MTDPSSRPSVSPQEGLLGSMLLLLLGPKNNWGALVLMFLFLILGWVQVIQRERTLRQEDYSTLSPREFELHIRDVFLALSGWQAKDMGGSHDLGMDIEATAPDGQKWAIQAKHYAGNVGIAAVQEVFLARTVYDCDRALVVVSGSGYTKSAKFCADKAGVELWTGEHLRQVQRAARARQPLPFLA